MIKKCLRVFRSVFSAFPATFPSFKQIPRESVLKPVAVIGVLCGLLVVDHPITNFIAMMMMSFILVVLWNITYTEKHKRKTLWWLSLLLGILVFLLTRRVWLTWAIMLICSYIWLAADMVAIRLEYQYLKRKCPNTNQHDILKAIRANG